MAGRDEGFEELGQAAILTRAYLADVDLRGTAAMEGDRGVFSEDMRQRLAEKWMKVASVPNSNLAQARRNDILTVWRTLRTTDSIPMPF